MTDGRIYTLSISHDRSESLTIEEARECVGEDQEQTYHIEKIKTSKEEGKF